MKHHFLLRGSVVSHWFNSVLVLTSMSLASCSSQQEVAHDQETAYKVSVQKVTGSQGTEQLDYSGNLEADNTVSMAFNVSGRVVAVNVEEGEHVVKGALLGSIEQVKYQSAYDIAMASYTKAEDRFRRNEELFKKGSLPERDFIASKADLAQAEANKEMAEKDLADTRLVAPFSGVVTEKVTELGALTSPGMPAFTLTKTDVMYATASIAEGDIARISVGDSVKVEIPALGKTRTGIVNIINPQADSYSRTFEVKVRLKNEGGEILPGMLSQLHINTGVTQQVIAIPTSCILRDIDNIAYVFLVQPDLTAIKKRIAISNAIGTSEVIVTSGLKAGDQLIVEGHSKLVDGSPIQF